MNNNKLTYHYPTFNDPYLENYWERRGVSDNGVDYENHGYPFGYESTI